MISILPTSSDRAARATTLIPDYDVGYATGRLVGAYGDFPRTHAIQAPIARRPWFDVNVRQLPTWDVVGRGLLCYAAPSVIRRSVRWPTNGVSLCH